MKFPGFNFLLPRFLEDTVTLPTWICPCEKAADWVTLFSSFSQQHSKLVFLIDKTVLEHMQQRFPLIVKFLRQYKVIAPGSGETLKSKEIYWQVLENLEAEGLKKEDALVLIGGGSLLDLGGFVASTYLRGIPYYSVPTTLLAFVDAAIGGKTGINLGGAKNRVGSFYQPLRLVLYYSFLDSLPFKEKVNGLAEVIKYSLLGDRSLFQALYEKTLKEVFEISFLQNLIPHCIGMKLALVEQDYEEKNGKRWLLNLGHTFGHAIETVSACARYSHGEAVAIGLMGAARFSASLGYLNEEALKRIEQVLLNYGLPTFLYEPLQISALLEAMQKDKKAKQASLRLILLKAIGEAFVYDLEKQAVLRSIWVQLGGMEGEH